MSGDVLHSKDRAQEQTRGDTRSALGSLATENKQQAPQQQQVLQGRRQCWGPPASLSCRQGTGGAPR